MYKHMIQELNLKNPIFFGILAAVVVYVILYLEKRSKGKVNTQTRYDGSVSIKLPVLAGIMVGGTAWFFSQAGVSVPEVSYGGNTLAPAPATIHPASALEQDIFTEQPDF